MELLINFFNTVLYQPLFNLLVLFYQYLPGRDFGVAVIALTVLVRIIFYPLNLKAIRSQKLLQELQPKIQEIQNKFKKDKEKLSKATIELYQKSKVNPLSGCLPILIQFPILVALFWVFQKGLRAEEMVNLYSFVPDPGQIIPTFLGILNLAQPSPVLALLCGIAQFVQTKMVTPTTQSQKGKVDFSTMMQKQMLYFFPVFTVLILWPLPSAIALYWLATSLFSIFQQYLIFKPQVKT
jgi:YidC/Oxa1 family membrane protein insertase